MNVETLVTLSVSVFLILILCFKIFKLSTKAKQSYRKIVKLEEAVADLKYIGNNNKRQAFRVNVDKAICEFQVVKADEDVMRNFGGRIFKGAIKDLSAHGMRLITHFDAPIQNKVEINFSFQIKDEQFTITGIPVRKESLHEVEHISYGIKFSNLTDKQKDELFELVFDLEMDARRIDLISSEDENSK